MTYICTVKEGTVILPPEAALPDGAKVRVEQVEEPAAAENSLARLFREIAGDDPALPEDLAEQHDHYLYGTPKR